MTTRWLTIDEIEKWVNPVLAERGWAQLNLNEEHPTCRVLGALVEVSVGGGGILQGFNVIQLYPMVGPLLVDPKFMTGHVSERLATEMQKYLADEGVRGYLAMCENHRSEQLCRSRGMTKIDMPVYSFVSKPVDDVLVDAAIEDRRMESFPL